MHCVDNRPRRQHAYACETRSFLSWIVHILIVCHYTATNRNFILNDCRFGRKLRPPPVPALSRPGFESRLHHRNGLRSSLPHAAQINALHGQYTPWWNIHPVHFWSYTSLDFGFIPSMIFFSGHVYYTVWYCDLITECNRPIVCLWLKGTIKKGLQSNNLHVQQVENSVDLLRCVRKTQTSHKTFRWRKQHFDAVILRSK